MAGFKEKLQTGWQLWQFKIASLFFLLGVFVLAVGAGLFIFRGSGSEVKVISSESSSGSTIELSEIIVDVGGAVNRPGVYSLRADSRVNDAVIAAGGLTVDADQSRVNLAAKVGDGQKVFVPPKSQQLTPRITSGQAIDPSTSSGLSNSPFDSSQGKQLTNIQDSALVSINYATEKELDTLPGVGPVTAGKIINGRPYSSIDELLNKKVVTRSVFEKIKDQITI